MTAETTPDTAAPETPAATLAGRTRPGPDGPSAGESSAGVLRPPSGSSFAGAEVFVGALVLFGALAWLNIASLRTLEHSPRAAGPFLLVFGGLATMAVLRLRRHGGGAMAILAALGLALLGRGLAPGWPPLLLSIAPLLADAIWAHGLRDALVERRDRADLASLPGPGVTDERFVEVASRLSPARFPELAGLIAERGADAPLWTLLESLPADRRGALGARLDGAPGLRLMRLALAEAPDLELSPCGAVDPTAPEERVELEKLVALNNDGARLALVALLRRQAHGWDDLLPRLAEQAAAELGGEPEQAIVAAELFRALPAVEREAALDRMRDGRGPDRATLLGLLSAAPKAVSAARLRAASEVLAEDDPHAIETLLIALELRTTPGPSSETGDDVPAPVPEPLEPSLVERLQAAAARIREHHAAGENPVADSFVARMTALAELPVGRPEPSAEGSDREPQNTDHRNETTDTVDTDAMDNTDNTDNTEITEIIGTTGPAPSGGSRD